MIDIGKLIDLKHQLEKKRIPIMEIQASECVYTYLVSQMPELLRIEYEPMIGLTEHTKVFLWGVQCFIVPTLAEGEVRFLSSSEIGKYAQGNVLVTISQQGVGGVYGKYEQTKYGLAP